MPLNQGHSFLYRIHFDGVDHVHPSDPAAVSPRLDDCPEISESNDPFAPDPGSQPVYHAGTPNRLDVLLDDYYIHQRISIPLLYTREIHHRMNDATTMKKMMIFDRRRSWILVDTEIQSAGKERIAGDIRAGR